MILEPIQNWMREMSDTLNDDEIARLATLGREIALSLECHEGPKGIPCRTDRLEAVRLMREFVQIHDS